MAPAAGVAAGSGFIGEINLGLIRTVDLEDGGTAAAAAVAAGLIEASPTLATSTRGGAVEAGETGVDMAPDGLTAAPAPVREGDFSWSLAVMEACG